MQQFRSLNQYMYVGMSHELLKVIHSSDYNVNISLCLRIVDLGDEVMGRWRNVRNEEPHNL
jgi:hypothetical protein